MALKFRRGTTAQQSGSLAFGEPYVNTTLGTLVVGGTSGDIVLSTSGTGSTGNFGAISGSGLDITGNANVAGNVTIGGQLTIGDQTSDTVNVVAALSSSLIPQTTNAFDLGSASKIWRDLYISTGSIKFVDGTTVVGIFDLNSYNSLKSSTGSANVSIANLNSETASLETRLSTLATLTGSNSIKLTNLESTTASLNTSVSNINTTTASLNTSVSNINTFTGSQLTQNTSLATISGSLISSASADRVSLTNIQTLTASVLTQLSAIGTETASLETRATSLATLTGSLISSASNLTQRVAANEAVSSSYARTNSANIFTGTQTITGSLYISQDLVVAGSSSIQNISSSNLVIGAAYVTVNTNSPSSRYAGLIIIDSGSAGQSGSFFYDAVDDEMIFIHKGNGLNVTSSQVLMGPETYDNVGNETYLTKNRILKGGGYEHVADSQITDDGTTVSIVGNLDLTGSMKAPQLTTLGTYTGSVETRFTTLATLTGSNGVRLNNLETTSASVNTSVSNLNSFTSSQLTQNVSLATITGSLITSESNSTISIANLNAASSSYETKGRSIVSGSSQIDATLTTNWATGIKTQLNSNTVVSGSSQVIGSAITTNTITIGSTSTALGGTSTTLAGLSSVTSTGFTGALTGNASTATTLQTARAINGVSFNGSADITVPAAAGTLSGATLASGVTASSLTSVGTLTSLTVTGAITANGGVTVTGAITATGDITAYYTSDKRHKNNIQLITNALAKVSKLNGVTWEWNDDVHEVTKSTPKTGLIAQDVQEVLPEVVKEREDGFLSLDYSKMMGLLVEAIKEQQTQIHSLTIEIEELKKAKGL